MVIKKGEVKESEQLKYFSFFDIPFGDLECESVLKLASVIEQEDLSPKSFSAEGIFLML